MAQGLMVFQGGGPTPVINATLAGILGSAGRTFDRIVGMTHSLENPAPQDWVDLTPLSEAESDHAVRLRAMLARTPGAALGSSRNPVTAGQLQELVRALHAHQVGNVIGIGGNGTMQILDMLAEVAAEDNKPLRIVGAPKTVDNDIPGVAFAPGFGSAARFVAMAVRDFDCDFRAMQTFDDVTILETMGRDTGWLAAASIILRDKSEDAPHLVLIPERPVDEEQLVAHIADLHRQYGRVLIVTNEVLTDQHGQMLGAEIQDGPTDALGRTLYSLSTGTAHYLARGIRQQLKFQVRCLRPGNLSRAFSSCVSERDSTLAYSCGEEAVRLLEHACESALMLTIDEDLAFASQPARAGTGKKPLPDRYIDHAAPFGVHPNYKADIAGIIGTVDPIFRLEEWQ